MKIQKCSKCQKPVSTDDIDMTAALMANELGETFVQMAKDLRVDLQEATQRLLRPILDETPVCSSCFIALNARRPMSVIDPLATPIRQSFLWRQVRIVELDA